MFPKPFCIRLLPRFRQVCLQSFSSHASDDFSKCFQNAITPAVCADLEAKGYAVVDNVWLPRTNKLLREELESLYHRSMMHANCTHLVKDNAVTLLAKSNIYEAELTLDSKVQDAAPIVNQINEDRTLMTMLSLFMPKLTLDSQAIKMQYNCGTGGCFPAHFDSDEQLDGRRITAICYLNDGWQAAEGGALRLYPWPAPPVDVLPSASRLVLFSSCRMLHRVCPSHRPRSCFTIWMGCNRKRQRVHTGAPLQDAAPPDPSDVEAAMQFLMQPPVRKHVVRLVYAEEWRRSLLESHPESASRDAALAEHEAEVATISRILSPYADIIAQMTKEGASASPPSLPLPRPSWF